MIKFWGAATTTLLVSLTLFVAPQFAFAASPADAPEKSIPQGNDPPGADEKQTEPPAEHKGVITPPPTGDNGIYTEVPNPEAGHEKEVIPPPGTSGGNPNVEPR
jgi:hypothetical protein